MSKQETNTDWGAILGGSAKSEQKRTDAGKAATEVKAEAKAGAEAPLVETKAEVVAPKAPVASVQKAPSPFDSLMGPSPPTPPTPTPVPPVPSPRVEAPRVPKADDVFTLEKKERLPPAPITEFDFSEVKESAQICITLYGLKGESKTYTAFSVPGEVNCLSFDKKAFPVKESMYNADARLHVYDAVRYLREDSDLEMLDSAERTLKYVFGLLDSWENNKPDWIIIDGSEILVNVCELVMRARNGLQPFSGVQMSLWKARRAYLKQVHRKAMSACKRGLIYTTYVEEQVLKREAGNIVESKAVPKWVGIQMEETDVVLHVTAEDDKRSGTTRYFVHVDSSKVPEFKTGLRVETTNKPLTELFPDLMKTIK